MSATAVANRSEALATPFTRHAHVDVPLVCGAMYPCSNPELVAAVSEAGAIGIVQPISLTYVHGHEFRAGLRYIRGLTSRPIGFNALIERSSRRYHERMVAWVDVALEEGIRFFVTSLGNPRWVVERVGQVGGVVYHDVTERRWAQKGLDAGVNGLIAVNDRAGGHAGPLSAARLLDDVADLGLRSCAPVALDLPTNTSPHCEWGMRQHSWARASLRRRSAARTLVTSRRSSTRMSATSS